jgi:hypothetical protein
MGAIVEAHVRSQVANTFGNASASRHLCPEPCSGLCLNFVTFAGSLYAKPLLARSLADLYVLLPDAAVDEDELNKEVLVAPLRIIETLAKGLRDDHVQDKLLYICGASS